MIEKLTEQFGAKEYLKLGGRWDEETFNELRDIVAKKEEDPIPVRDSFFEQAEGIERSSELKITLEERYLYGVLREKPVENTLSDIQLMAEVILLRGNTAKRKLFESKYPHIDFNALMVVLEFEQEGIRQITYGNDKSVLL